MAERDYMPLPLEYIKTLELLSDAEFGLLVRSLMAYAVTGVLPQLEDRTMQIVLSTCAGKQDYYARQFDEICARNHERALKGAAARWNKS